MNDLVKLGILGAIGYVAYEYLLAPATVAATTPVATSSVPVSSTSSTVTVPVTAPASSLSATIQQMAVGDPAIVNGMSNVYVWNYYYIRAIGQPNLVLAGQGAYGLGDLDLISLPNYLALVKAANPGVAGLQGLKKEGMGMIVDLKKMFAGVAPGTGFGAREFVSVANPGVALPNGLGSIVDDALMSAGYIDEGPFNEAAAFNGSQATPQVADFYAAASGQGN